jgi:rubredoxin
VTYKCTGCDMVFSSKLERDVHYRGECLSFVNVMDVKGKITRVERIDDKFECPLCLLSSPSLVLHFFQCV